MARAFRHQTWRLRYAVADRCNHGSMVCSCQRSKARQAASRRCDSVRHTAQVGVRWSWHPPHPWHTTTASGRPGDSGSHSQSRRPQHGQSAPSHIVNAITDSDATHGQPLGAIALDASPFSSSWRWRACRAVRELSLSPLRDAQFDTACQNDTTPRRCDSFCRRCCACS